MKTAFYNCVLIFETDKLQLVNGDDPELPEFTIENMREVIMINDLDVEITTNYWQSEAHPIISIKTK